MPVLDPEPLRCHPPSEPVIPSRFGATHRRSPSHRRSPFSLFGATHLRAHRDPFWGSFMGATHRILFWVPPTVQKASPSADPNREYNERYMITRSTNRHTASGRCHPPAEPLQPFRCHPPSDHRLQCLSLIAPDYSFRPVPPTGRCTYRRLQCLSLDSRPLRCHPPLEPLQPFRCHPPSEPGLQCLSLIAPEYGFRPVPPTGGSAPIGPLRCHPPENSHLRIHHWD